MEVGAQTRQIENVRLSGTHITSLTFDVGGRTRSLPADHW